MGYKYNIWHEVSLRCSEFIHRELASLGPVCFTWNKGELEPMEWYFDAPLIDFANQLNELQKLGVRGTIIVVGRCGDHTKYSLGILSVQVVTGWVQYWTMKEYQMPQNASWRIRIHKNGQRGAIYHFQALHTGWEVDGEDIKFREGSLAVPAYVKRKVKSLSKLARAWADIPKVLP